ncbi:unnamed protein product, partial [Nesidiocoris tenuis]
SSCSGKSDSTQWSHPTNKKIRCRCRRRSAKFYFLSKRSTAITAKAITRVVVSTYERLERIVGVICESLMYWTGASRFLSFGYQHNGTYTLLILIGTRWRIQGVGHAPSPSSLRVSHLAHSAIDKCGTYENFIVDNLKRDIAHKTRGRFTAFFTDHKERNRLRPSLSHLLADVASLQFSKIYDNSFPLKTPGRRTADRQKNFTNPYDGLLTASPHDPHPPHSPPSVDPHSRPGVLQALDRKRRARQFNINNNNDISNRPYSQHFLGIRSRSMRKHFVCTFHWSISKKQTFRFHKTRKVSWRGAMVIEGLDTACSVPFASVFLRLFSNYVQITGVHPLGCLLLLKFLNRCQRRTGRPRKKIDIILCSGFWNLFPPTRHPNGTVASPRGITYAYYALSPILHLLRELDGSRAAGVILGRSSIPMANSLKKQKRSCGCWPCILTKLDFPLISRPALITGPSQARQVRPSTSIAGWPSSDESVLPDRRANGRWDIPTGVRRETCGREAITI